MIAFCGLVCTDCEAFIVTQKDDDEKRKELAKKWSKEFSKEIKPEEVYCDGCLALEGRHIGYCDVCEIRKCGLDKEVENCAYCEEYACEKLLKFFNMAPNAKKTLEEIRKSL